MICTCSSLTAAGHPDRRRTMLEIDGEVHSISCWAARTGKFPGTVSKRIHDGLSAEEAVFKPVKPRPPCRGGASTRAKSPPAGVW